MLRNERYEDPEEALRAALMGWQSEIWTALPGIVDSVDLAKMTCVIQPTIQGQFRQSDGTLKTVTMPLCLDVPIHFMRGGGFTHTFPLAKNDEGLLIFCSRCHDAWWQNGGVQPQAEIRFHSLSDGWFIPGASSQPKVIASISTDSTQLRSDDGSTYVEVKNDQTVNIVAPGGCNINGLIIDVHGNLTTPGSIQAGTGTGDSVTLQGHTHKNVQTGSGNSGNPNAGT